MIQLLNKLKFYGLLVGACIFLGSYVVILHNKVSNLEASVAVYKDFTSSLREGAKFYRARNGNLVAQVQSLTASKKDFKEIVDNIDYLKNNFDGVKNNLRNVNGVLATVVSASRQIEAPLVDTTYVLSADTVDAWSFRNVDPFFSIEGIVIPSPQYRKVIATPTLNADFYGILIEKRDKPKRRFLGIGIGRKSEKFELTTTNPYIAIDSLSFIKK